MAFGYLGGDSLPLGIPRNLKKGVGLFCKLADEEDLCESMVISKAEIQEMACYFYLMGVGVKRDLKKAQQCCDKAEALGSKDVRENMNAVKDVLELPVLNLVMSPIFKHMFKKVLKKLPDNKE